MGLFVTCSAELVLDHRWPQKPGNNTVSPVRRRSAKERDSSAGQNLAKSST